MKFASCLFIAVCTATAAAPGVVYTINTLAGSASIGDGGPAVSAQIGNIQGITLDRAGNRYLSDTDRNLIRNGTLEAPAAGGKAPLEIELTGDVQKIVVNHPHAKAVGGDVPNSSADAVL